MTKWPWWAAASVVATVLLCSVSLSARYRVEAGNRAVGLLMEAGAIREAAAVEGRTFDEALGYLADRGLTGVAVTEQRVADVVATGRLSLFTTDRGTSLQGPPSLLARVARGVARRGGLGGPPLSASDSALGLSFRGDLDALSVTSIGIDPETAESVRRLGLVLVARHANAVGSDPAYIRDVLEESRENGATAYLPAGDQVLGFRTSLEDTALALNDIPLDYLTPEFVRLAGDSTVSAEAIGRTARLHAMQQAEADRTALSTIVERYAKAYRERNVRWLLVRPPSLGGPGPLRGMAQTLLAVERAVVAEGGVVRTPRPFDDPVPAPWVAPLIALAALPALAWGVGALFPRGRARQAALLAIGLLAGLGVVEPTRPLAAFGLSVAFPILGYLWLRAKPEAPVPLAYAVVTGLSLVGGLCVAGMLVGLPYMLQLEQFVGVKASVGVPLLVVGLILLVDHVRPSELWAKPILWGTAAVGLVGLAALAFMLARTGNENPAAVSDLELRFRSVLDRILHTRPRTKEFLIGHPALVVGLALRRLAGSRPTLGPWASILLVVGAIGQTSVVNTLCHLHTPLDVSLTRVVIGWVLGGILGAVAWWGVRRIVQRAL